MATDTDRDLEKEKKKSLQILVASLCLYKDLGMPSSRIIPVGPKSNDECPYKRRQTPRERPCDNGCRDGVMCLQARGHQGLPAPLESGERPGTYAPSEPQGEPGLPTQIWGFWPPGLGGGIHSCCLSDLPCVSCPNLVTGLGAAVTHRDLISPL